MSQPKKSKNPSNPIPGIAWDLAHASDHQVLTYNGRGNLSVTTDMHTESLDTGKIKMEGKDVEISAEVPIKLAAPLPKDKIDRLLQQGALHNPKKLQHRINQLFIQWEETGKN